MKLWITASFLFLTFLGTLFITQHCKKKPDTTDAFDDKTPITGYIWNSKNIPLKNVKIKLGRQNVLSSASGYFTLRPPKSNTPQSQLIIFKHKKYVTTYKSIRAHRQMEAYMLRATVKKINLSKTVRIKSKKIDIKIPALALVDEYGFSVKKVKVKYSVLNPRRKKDAKHMPGRLIAIADGQEKKLESFGMFDISFFGKNNNKLKIKKGSEITVKLPVKKSMLGGSSTIPLWSFDTHTGIWTKEGTARVLKRKGRKVWVEAKISHTSWWNLDRFIDPNEITAIRIKKIKDENGKLLKKVTLNVVGMSYGGLVQKSFMNSGMSSICIEAKRNERVRLEAFVIFKKFRLKTAKNIRTNAEPSDCNENIDKAIVMDVITLKKSSHFLSAKYYEDASTICNLEDLDFPVTQKQLLGACKIENLTKITLTNNKIYNGIFKQTSETILIITKRGVLSYPAKLIKKITEL